MDAGSDAAADFPNSVLSMTDLLRAQRRSERCHARDHAADETAHLHGARSPGGALERVQFFRTHCTVRVTVFHAVKIRPQERDHKRSNLTPRIRKTHPS